MNPFIEDFQENVMPMMMASFAIIVIITDKLDSKICLELGAGILLDKPIIVVTASSTLVSAHLTKCAHKIIIGNVKDPKTEKELHSTIEELIDARENKNN